MYINMCIYVYLHTYVKWMSTGLMLACLKRMQSCLMPSCHKNGCSPVSYNLAIKMDAVLSHAIKS